MPAKFRKFQDQKKIEAKEQLLIGDDPLLNQQFQEDISETNTRNVNQLIEQMSRIAEFYEEQSDKCKPKGNQIIQNFKKIKKQKRNQRTKSDSINQETTIIEKIMRDQTKDIVENLNSQLFEIQKKISDKYSKKEQLIEEKFKQLENETQQEELIEQLEKTLTDQKPLMNSWDEYKVEKIIDRKYTKLGFAYKIKWEGFSEDHSTWERIENLSDIIERVKEFDIAKAGVISDQTLQFEKEFQKKQNKQTQLEKLKQVIEDQFKMIRDTNEDKIIEEIEQEQN